MALASKDTLPAEQIYLGQNRIVWPTINWSLLAAGLLVSTLSISAGRLIAVGPVVVLIVFGILFALLLLIVAIKNPRRVFHSWLFIAPILPWFLGISMFGGSYVMNLPRLLMFVLTLGLTITLATRKPGLGNFPLRGFFLACMLAYVGSAVFSILPRESVIRLFAETWLGSFLVFYLAYFFTQTEADAYRTLSVVLLAAGTVSVITIFTSLTNSDFRTWFSFWVPFNANIADSGLAPEMLVSGRDVRGQIDLLRNSAGLSHPLELGNYLAFLFPLAWGRMLTAGRRKWMYRVLVSLMAGGIIFSFERSALLVAGVGAMSLTFLSRRGLGWLLGLLAGLGILITTVYIIPNIDWGGGSANPFSVSSLIAYVQLYGTFANRISHESFPLVFGLGPSVSNLVFWRALSVTMISDSLSGLRGADSPILLKLQESGLLGVLCWLAFLVRCAYLIWKSGISDHKNMFQVSMDQIAVAIGLLGSLMVCVLVAGVFAWPQSTVVVMACLGVTLKLGLLRLSRNNVPC